jgi:hypothetical protein
MSHYGDRMFAIRPILATYLCILAVWSAWSQQPQSSGPTNDPFWVVAPVRTPEALAIVQGSLAALGGSDAISKLQSFVVQGNLAVTDSNVQSGNVVWEVAGQELRFDFPASDGIRTIATGHGSPFVRANGVSSWMPDHTMRALFIPPLVARNLNIAIQDLQYSIEFGGAGVVGNTSIKIVTISSQASRRDSIATLQTWYFDSVSGLPVRVEYRVPDCDDVRHFLAASAEVSNYKSMSSVYFPLQANITIAGHPSGTITISSIAINGPIQGSDFDNPGAAQ